MGVERRAVLCALLQTLQVVVALIALQTALCVVLADQTPCRATHTYPTVVYVALWTLVVAVAVKEVLVRNTRLAYFR